jgi:glucosamine--fructose-6-phosphate aminotransferase (isomerizing)
MCGIAGFSLASRPGLDRSALAKVLLAGLAERGQDATGYGYRAADGSVRVVKESQKLARMIDRIDLPADTPEAVMHVREYTKGLPGLNDNNHPVRWGRVTGVHNGHIDNDDELFALHRRERSTPEITVDSEAIMMLTAVLGDLGRALERVHGSAAVAVLEDDRPGRVTVARRTRRPLVVARGEGIAVFASTREPLELVASGAGLRLQYEDVEDGTVLEFERGREIARRRFAVDYRFAGRKIPEYPRLAEQDRLVRSALSAFRVAPA